MLMPAVNRAAETRHELLSEPSLEEEKELYRAYEEERIERLYEEEHAKESAAFEMKYGRPPESDEELYSADLSDICFIDNDFPKPISEDKLLELRRNNNLSPVYGYTEEGVEIITDYKERSYDEVDAVLPSYIDRLSREALYNLFFEPINEEALRSDLYRHLDTYKWHHDAAYYEIEDKLADFRNYCKKKEDPYGLRALISDMQLSDDQLDLISDVVSDTVKDAFESQQKMLRDIRRDIKKDVAYELKLLKFDLGVLKDSNKF